MEEVISKQIDMQITHQEERDCISKGYAYLGWQVYAGNCPPLAKCHELGHKLGAEKKEVSHNQRGSDHTVWCDECKLWWKIDSSD